MAVIPPVPSVGTPSGHATCPKYQKLAQRHSAHLYAGIGVTPPAGLAAAGAQVSGTQHEVGVGHAVAALCPPLALPLHVSNQ